LTVSSSFIGESAKADSSTTFYFYSGLAIVVLPATTDEFVDVTPMNVVYFFFIFASIAAFFLAARAFLA
jgi:hypothetical protein